MPLRVRYSATSMRPPPKRRLKPRPRRKSMASTRASTRSPDQPTHSEGQDGGVDPPSCPSAFRPRLLLFLEELQVVPVTLGSHPADRNETHRRRVHAVAKSGRLGTVVEEVAEMRIGVSGADLGARHEQ